MARTVSFAFVAASALLLGFQASFPQIIDPDGFFHIRIAERFPRLDMPWMPYSVFADGWVDHQLLFHMLMAPFAWLFDDDVAAAKSYAALAGAGAFTAMGALLRAHRAPWPWFFAALPFALSWTFLLRMGMPRTQSLALVLLCAVLHLLFTRGLLGLAVAAFVFAWTYHVGAIVVPIAGLWAVVAGLWQWRRDAQPPRWPPLRSLVAPPLAAASGFLAGLLIHPQSPRTLTFLWMHVFQKVGNQLDLPVGDEWRRGGLHTLTGPGGPSLALTLVAALLTVRNRPGRSPETMLALLVAAGAHLALLQGSKFIEYAAPFAAMALALSLRDVGWSPARGLRKSLRVALVGVVLAVGWTTAASTAARVRRNDPLPHRVEGAASWLRANVAPGEIVYHFDWGDFPELVFHAPEFRYIVGLDPHFLALARPDLWDLHHKIALGWGKNPSKPIRGQFGARWAVLVLPWEGAVQALGADPGLIPRYRDADTVVYEVQPQP